jgi:hypothetical protein
MNRYWYVGPYQTDKDEDIGIDSFFLFSIDTRKNNIVMLLRQLTKITFVEGKCSTVQSPVGKVSPNQT